MRVKGWQAMRKTFPEISVKISEEMFRPLRHSHPLSWRLVRIAKKQFLTGATFFLIFLDNQP
jgi:hypothetical protein